MEFSLSVHADYRCRHSGACCTAGWAIPVEPDRQAALAGAVLVPDRDGACRFFDRATHLCAVHRDHGETALPESCRQFPRVALLDDRGTHVTLSHFCPTAAALLFRDDVAVAIVAAPPAFPAAREYDGLDARGEWPPMVHRTLLFDLDAYDAWERFAVRTLGEVVDSRRALTRIATLAEHLRRWTPADGAMAAFVERLAESVDPDPRSLERYEPIRAAAGQIVMEAVPPGLRELAHDASRTSHLAPRTSHVAPRTSHPDPAPCRYLAAKAFASWTAYQGRGVRTLVADLVLADSLVASLASSRPLLDAIREADRLLIHLVDRPRLVERLGTVEGSA